MRITLTTLSTIALMAFVATQANAQFSSSGGTFGGASNVGGSAGVGQGFGSNTQSFGSNTGQGAFGNFGGGQGQGQGQGIGQTQGGDQNAGQLTGSERFIEGNRQPGSFVGSDTTDATNARGVVQGQAGQQQNALQGLQNLFQNNPNLNNNTNTSRTIRARVRLGFQPRTVAASTVRTALTNHLQNLPRFESLGIQVAMEGETVILRGTVGSDEEKALVAGVARLEPGVWDVRNELLVGQADSTVEGPANPLDLRIEELIQPRP